MAQSATVGILRVLLSADSAEFQQGVAKAASAAQTFTKDLKTAGAQTEAIGEAMTKAFGKAEQGTRGLSTAVASLLGFDAIEKANTYAKAVETIGGASKLTATEQSKVNTIVSEAVAKYAVLGREAPAALTALAKATSPIVAETEKVTASTSKLTGFMGDLGTQVKATALGFVGAQAVIGLVQSSYHAFVSFLAGSIDEYAKQETAVKKLTTALQAQGRATPDVVDGYKAMASQFQRTTVFADEQINEMQALLVEVGDVAPAQMEKALTAATDLSAGLGIDLTNATTLVGKAFAGETGTLKRYGIVIDEAKLKTEGASAVLDAIQAKFGGQAQAEVETYAGKVKQLANAWGEVQEAIGKSVVTDPVVIALMAQLQHAVVGTGNAADEAGGTWTEFWGYVAGGELARMGLVALSEVLRFAQSVEASVRNANDEIKRQGTPEMFTGGFGALRPEQQAFLDQYAKGMEANAIADKKASDAADAHAKAVRALMDAYSGATVIKAALDATEAFHRNTQAGIALSKMTRDQQDALNKTLQAGIDTYKALGIEAPKSLRAAYTETFRLDRLLDEVEPKLSALPSSLQGIGEAIEAGVVPPLQAWQRIMDPLLKDLDKLPPGLLQIGAIAAPTFDEVKVKGERAGAAVSEIGRALQDVGRTIPGVAGQVIAGMGGIASAVGSLQSAFAQAATSQHAFALQSAASVAFVIGTYQQLVSAVTKLTGDLGATEFFNAVNARGGRAGVQTSGVTAGFNTQILLTTRSAETFRGELARFDRAVGASNDRLQRYGLTWRDLGDHIQQANIDQLSRDLVKDWRDLGNAGVDVTKRITAMSGGLSQLVVDAVATGQQIPVALQPMLETLIRSGKLSEDAARALLGMSGKAVIAFKDVEEAASRYGIEIDQLGPAVKQLKINDVAAQIIKDWTLLQAAGADTNTTLVGMQKSVQDVVTAALTAGVKIPIGMKPIIEAMIQAGLLTDEFGNKLTDTGEIEFEKPITDAINDLITALDKLIDKLSGVGNEAIRTRGELEKIGTAMPRGSTGTGSTGTGAGDQTGTPTGEPTGTAPRPSVPAGTDPRNRYATGGIVGRVLAFPSALGADRIPIMAAEGEAILSAPAVRAIGRDGFARMNADWSHAGAPYAAASSDSSGAVSVTISVAINNPTVQDEAQLVALKRAMEDAVVNVLHRENATNARGVKTIVRRMAS